MKLTYIIFAFTLLSFFSCEKENRFQLAEQEILFSKDTVVFTNGNVGTLYLSVNVGNTLFNINDIPAWLKISRTQGNVNIPGTLIEFSVDLANPPTFTRKGIIEIESPLGVKKITVIYIFNQGGVAFVTKDVIIKNSEPSGYITIVNNLNKTINWSVTYTDPALSSDKSSGSLQVGDSNILKVTVDRSLLTSSGVYEGRIDFVIDGTQYITKVFVENFGQTVILDRAVVEAVFDKEHDFVYFISSSPKTINRYNLANGEMVSLALNFVPGCLALRPDFKKAIICHDTKLSEIDLTNMSLGKTHNIGINVLSVQLAQNDVVYIFSEQTNWGNLRWINLNSGKSYINTQKELTSGMVGQLHPNQKWLYSARKIGTDGSLEKFIIDGDKTTYSHDYRSKNFEFAILESVWFTESGDKMLSGNQLLVCDEDPKKDMVIAGKLPFPKVFTWDIKILSAAHSETDRKFYISLYTNWPIEQYNSTLYVFDSQSLELVKSTEVINFNHNGEQHTPQLRYIFQNESKIILIMKSQEKDVWAINQLNK
jgi:Viral BACON domain